jgi:hypothetical protein
MIVESKIGALASELEGTLSTKVLNTTGDKGDFTRKRHFEIVGNNNEGL